MPIFVRYERRLTQPGRPAAAEGGEEPEARRLLSPSQESPQHRAMAVGALPATHSPSRGVRSRDEGRSVAVVAPAAVVGTDDAGATLPDYTAPPPGELGPPKVDMSAPPPYTECDQQGPGDVVVPIAPHNTGDISVEGLVEPPSYEEVQRIKAVEAQLESGDAILLPPHTGTVVGLGGSSGACEAGLAEARQPEEDLLGTDFLFFLAFAAAFFFNWVGFVVLVCFCHSVAGRSGALAGFGLSLSKWAVIVRHSGTLAPEANTWLLWLIMVLGLVICLRAVLQYASAKREWQHASQASRHRFLLFH